MTVTVFLKDELVAQGRPDEVVPAMRALQPLDRSSDLLAFDENGRQIDLDLRDGRLANVRLSGDFFLEPDNALHTINAALTGQPANASEASLATAVLGALPSEVMMYGVSPEAIAVTVHRALHQGSDA